MPCKSAQPFSTASSAGQLMVPVLWPCIVYERDRDHPQGYPPVLNCSNCIGCRLPVAMSIINSWRRWKTYKLWYKRYESIIYCICSLTWPTSNVTCPLKLLIYWPLIIFYYNYKWPRDKIKTLARLFHWNNRCWQNINKYLHIIE